jgi:hypothetical protein
MAALASASAVRAQDLEGLPIRSIEYRGLVSLPEDSLTFYLGIEIDGPYSALDINDNLHELWQRGLIENIAVVAEAADDGVALTITVEERPTLRSIEYQGLKRLSRSDIGEEISRNRLRVREGDPLNRGELRRLKRVIEELYAEKGFRLADAAYRIEAVDNDRKVIFTIDEGDKVRIEDIDFEGNTVYSDRRLRYTMKKTKESGFISRFRKKDIYKEPSLEEDLDSVRTVYQRAGYKNVVLGEPKIEIRAKNPNAPTLKQQNRKLYLTIPVEEGARWKLGEVTVAGNERFNDDVILRQFAEPKGGWLRSKVIEEGIETITEIYKNSGHIFASTWFCWWRRAINFGWGASSSRATPVRATRCYGGSWASRRAWCSTRAPCETASCVSDSSSSSRSMKTIRSPSSSTPKRRLSISRSRAKRAIVPSSCSALDSARSTASSASSHSVPATSSGAAKPSVFPSSRAVARTSSTSLTSCPGSWAGPSRPVSSFSAET